MNGRLVIIFVSMICCNSLLHAVDASHKPAVSLYSWVDDPANEMERVNAADNRLQTAIKNPEYMMDHWVELPTSPTPKTAQTQFLTLRHAILLALRYNPNIQNAELDRIIQRYQLRLAHNEFELQYAIAGTAVVEKSRYSGVGNATTKSYLLTPELDLKTRLGTQLSLKMDNNVAAYGNYNPLLNFSVKQPLLP